MNLKKKENLKCEMRIDISNDEIKKQNEKKIDELSKSLQLKGFRKGFIPKRVIELRFGNNIHQENLNKILNNDFINYIKKEKLNIVDNPVINKIVENKRDFSSFKLEFEVFPDIEINLTNITVQKYITKIADKDVEKEIDRLRLKHYEWKVVTTESKHNDLLVFDLYKKTGGTFQYILNKEELILDNKKHNIENLKLYLINKNINTEYLLTLKENKLYLLNDEKNNFVYLFIHQIKRKMSAEINEAFLQKLNFKEKKVTKLNSLIEEKLRFISNYLSEKIMKTNILNAMLDAHDFDIPDTLIKKEIGVEKNKNEIVKNLKLKLLLTEIKKKFNISISKMEIEKHANLLYSNDKQKIIDKKLFLENVENEIYMDKIFKIIEKKIKIIEKTVELDYLIKIGEQK